MRRREFLKYSAATAMAAPFVRAASADTGVYKVGVVGAKTGPLAPGAAVTHFPPFQLWAMRSTSAAVSSSRTASARSRSSNTTIARSRPRPSRPWSVWRRSTRPTGSPASMPPGFNLATAPTFDKYKYPQVTVACITDQAPALVKKYPELLHVQCVDDKLRQDRDRRAQKAEGQRPDRQQGRRR